MVLLENDAFLTALTLMYQNSRTSGSVFLTMKAYDGRKKPVPRDESKIPEPEGNFTLIRATLRSKKISTVVNAEGLTKFQAAFSNVLRSNMDGLKKQKKSKSKGNKATQ